MPIQTFEKSQNPNHPDLHILNDNIAKQRKKLFTFWYFIFFDILYIFGSYSL